MQASIGKGVSGFGGRTISSLLCRNISIQINHPVGGQLKAKVCVCVCVCSLAHWCARTNRLSLSRQGKRTMIYMGTPGASVWKNCFPSALARRRGLRHANQRLNANKQLLASKLIPTTWTASQPARACATGARQIQLPGGAGGASGARAPAGLQSACAFLQSDVTCLPCGRRAPEAGSGSPDWPAASAGREKTSQRCRRTIQLQVGRRSAARGRHEH